MNSNLTFNISVGTGTQTAYPITASGENMGYFRTSDITGYVDDVEVSTTIHPSTPHMIIFTTAPALGSKVMVRREMPIGKPYANFERGNNFGHRQVNNTFLQQLYLTQEILDGFLPEGFYWKNDIDMGGFGINNVSKVVTKEIDVNIASIVSLSKDLDINGNRLLNLPIPLSEKEPLRRVDVSSVSGIAPSFSYVDTKIRADSASQLDGVYVKDYAAGDIVPADAMKNKLMYWHDGQFYSVGTDIGFVSRDFVEDLSKGWFVGAGLLSEHKHLTGRGFAPQVVSVGIIINPITNLVIISGNYYPLEKQLTGQITEINLSTTVPYVIAGGVTARLYNYKYFSFDHVNFMSCWCVGDGVADDTDGLEFALGQVYYDANSEAGFERARKNQIKLYSPSGKTYRTTQPLFIGNANIHPDPSWSIALQIEMNGSVIQGDLANSNDYTLSILKSVSLHSDTLTVMSRTSHALYLNTIAHSRIEGLSIGSSGGSPLTLRGYIYNCKFGTTRIGSLAGLTGGAPGIDANFTASPKLHAFRGMRIASFDGLYVSGCDKAMSLIGDTSSDAQGVLNEGIEFVNFDWEANTNESIVLIQTGKRISFKNGWNEGASTPAVLNKVINAIGTDSVMIDNCRSGAHYHKINLQNTKNTTISNVSDGSITLTGDNDTLVTTNCSFKLNSPREFLINLFLEGEPKYRSLTNFRFINTSFVDIRTGNSEYVLNNCGTNEFVKNEYIVNPTALTDAKFTRLTKASGTGISPLGYPVTNVTANTTTTARQSIKFNLDVTKLTNGVRGTGVLLTAIKWNTNNSTNITDCGTLSDGKYGNGAQDVKFYQAGNWIIYAQRVNLNVSTVIELVFNNQVPLPVGTTFEFGGSILYAGSNIEIPQL